MDLSIVIPVYGCEDCLYKLHERLTGVLSSLSVSYEILMIDDCSRDNAWSVIKKLSQQDRKLRGIQLSRNYGQHIAITAGLSQSNGRFVVVMDCDLQEPPELIPRLWSKAQEGFDIVYTARKKRKDSLFKRSLAQAYNKIIHLLSGKKTNPQRSNLSIISRAVVNGFLQFNDCNRHYLYILSWMGFPHSEIEYEHEARHSGKSSYSLSKLIKHSMSGMFFHTNRLLYAIVYMGLAFAFAGLGMAVFYILRYYIWGAYPGWTSIAVLILCTGGFLGVSIGVCGLYIGEIFEQVKGRPLFVIGRDTSKPSDSPQTTS